MEVEAKLYAGRVSEAHPARVRRNDQTITIRYTDETGTEQIAEWPINATRLSEWSPAGKTRLQFGPFPHQYLDVPTDVYGSLMQQGSLQPKPVRPGFSLYAFILSRVFVGLLIVGGSLALISWLIYAYALPALSSRAAQLVPVEQEIALGKVMSKSLFQTSGYAVDQARTQRINQYWQATGIRTNFPIRITVVRSNEVNAFAVPGGQIVVFDGILKRMKRHEELAALLAHEAAHIEQRHTLQQLFRSVAAYGALSVVFGDVSGLTALLIENADKLISLSYSRHHEAEADAFAVTQLAKTGINPQGTVWLMEHLPTEGEVVPSLLRSHPQNKERIEATKELAAQTLFQPVDKPELERLWLTVTWTATSERD